MASLPSQNSGREAADDEMCCGPIAAYAPHPKAVVETQDCKTIRDPALRPTCCWAIIPPVATRAEPVFRTAPAQ